MSRFLIVKRIAIETMRRTDWAHVKAREKHSGIVMQAVATLGERIQTHKVVIGRGNDGMMSLRFAK